MNVSLPIKIFEPRSFLEKVAKDFAYAPYFLNQAYFIKDTLEWFKLIVSWFVSNVHLEPQMKKPFNPILGETF